MEQDGDKGKRAQNRKKTDSKKAAQAERRCNKGKRKRQRWIKGIRAQDRRMAKRGKDG